MYKELFLHNVDPKFLPIDFVADENEELKFHVE